jgi:hypothetical protein
MKFMRMPFHVGAKGMNYDEDVLAHALNVSSPLLYGFNGRVN